MKHSFRFLLFATRIWKELKKNQLIAYIDFVLKYGTIENEIPRDILEDFDDKCILHAV